MSEIRSQATPAVSVRDRMTRIARTLLVTRQYHSPSMAMLGLIDALADAGWSKPRTVNNAAELDALPNMTVVMDNCDDVSQKRGGQWCGYETADLTSKQIAKYGPLTVLFTPGEAG